MVQINTAIFVSAVAVLTAVAPSLGAAIQRPVSVTPTSSTAVRAAVVSSVRPTATRPSVTLTRASGAAKATAPAKVAAAVASATSSTAKASHTSKSQQASAHRKKLEEAEHKKKVEKEALKQKHTHLSAQHQVAQQSVQGQEKLLIDELEKLEGRSFDYHPSVYSRSLEEDIINILARSYYDDLD